MPYLSVILLGEAILLDKAGPFQLLWRSRKLVLQVASVSNSQMSEIREVSNGP
jgi:hypothetical protein